MGDERAVGATVRTGGSAASASSCAACGKPADNGGVDACSGQRTKYVSSAGAFERQAETAARTNSSLAEALKSNPSLKGVGEYSAAGTCFRRTEAAPPAEDGDLDMSKIKMR